MSVISIVTIFLIGWLVYRLLQPRQVMVSPLSVAMMWVLGTGAMYLVYYGFVGFLQQNPPPLLFVIVAGVGVAEVIRVRGRIIFSGWQVLRVGKIWLIILGVILVMMSLSIFMSGFYADTTRMWMAKGDMLNQLPDYVNLMERFTAIRHPDYPMVMSHQYQWQMVWADDWRSLKLSTWVWYVMLLLSALTLLTRYTKFPLRWLILLAGYPSYWFVVPLATVDIPLSVMVLVAVGWTLEWLDNQQVAWGLIALVCGVMVLTKNEGFLIVGSMLAGLMATVIAVPEKRRQLLYLIAMIIAVSGVSFASWYLLIVPQADIAVAGDFGLSGFALENIPAVLRLILPVLLNPLQTAGLWILFLFFVAMRYWQTPVLWLTVLLYLLVISASYMFSVRQTTLFEHINQSYFRLILQIMPLAFVYVARCFSQSEVVAD